MPTPRRYAAIIATAAGLLLAAPAPAVADCPPSAELSGGINHGVAYIDGPAAAIQPLCSAIHGAFCLFTGPGENGIGRLFLVGDRPPASFCGDDAESPRLWRSALDDTAETVVEYTGACGQPGQFVAEEAGGQEADFNATDMKFTFAPLLL